MKSLRNNDERRELITAERDQLKALEAVVERGLETFVEVGRALGEIRDARLYRDDHATFADYLRERWDMGRSQGYRLIDAAAVVDVVSPNGDTTPPSEAVARELVPLLRDDEAKVVEVWRELRAEHGDDVTAEKVREGARAAVRREQKQQRKAQRLVEPEPIIGEPDLDVCDVGDLVLDEPVDWIITDPPYRRADLGVYNKLGACAARNLREGGGLICMSGQSYLPDVMASLAEHLDYQWTVAYLTPGGQSAQLWDRHVNTFWKPLLWYTNGEYDGNWIGDVTRSEPNDNDKRFHHWGQSETGMADIVRRFTAPDDVILDPFVGGGTTLVVAMDLGRRCIARDNDPTVIDKLRSRFIAPAVPVR